MAFTPPGSVPGKKRFGQKGFNQAKARVGSNIQAAAARRLGSPVSRAGVAAGRGKVSGGGLGNASQPGPSTSPLAAKRQVAIKASISKTPVGVTTSATPQQNAQAALGTAQATIKPTIKKTI